jgi:hypothetical protein
VAGEESENIKRGIWTDLLFDVLILVMIQSFGANSSCGIPIYKWTVVYFIIIALRSIANLLRLYVVRHFFRYRNQYGVISFLIVDGAFLSWLFYGNFLFYSDLNDCQSNPDTNALYNLMLSLLLIGYL